MLKKIGRIALAILLISGMIFTILYISKNSKSEAKEIGTITVIINSKDNEILDKRRITYKEGDTLYSIIDKEYTLSCEDTVYGHYILGIKGDSFSIETDKMNSWVWLEMAYLKEDKEYSDSLSLSDYQEVSVNKGIDGLELVDNMILGINERDASHPSSIFEQTEVSFGGHESSTNPKDTMKIYRIAMYIILGIFILGILIYCFFTRKQKNSISIYDLCVLSCLTVILFVQEELLSFLPNIQFTFLLLAVYVNVFGFRKTSMIVFAHVLLDNLIMGSLTPIVMVPMLLGYLFYIGIIALVKKKGLLWITLAGVLGSLVYCYLFLLFNAIFLDIDVLAYFIADIPFEILLCLSTILTLVYLYYPLSGKLVELWKFKKENSEENGEIV